MSMGGPWGVRGPLAQACSSQSLGKRGVQRLKLSKTPSLSAEVWPASLFLKVLAQSKAQNSPEKTTSSDTCLEIIIAVYDDKL